MATDVECCDLLSNQGEFIHVKKRGASATLSHLFAQGSVAAELFMQEGEFREQVRQRLAADGCAEHVGLIPEGRPPAGQFKVVYAIIAKHDAQNRPPRLPFFSAVNLMQHHQRLQRLGMEASIRYIPCLSFQSPNERFRPPSIVLADVAVGAVEEVLIGVELVFQERTAEFLLHQALAGRRMCRMNCAPR